MFEQGYQTIVQHLSQGLTILTNHVVDTIEHTDAGVTVGLRGQKGTQSGCGGGDRAFGRASGGKLLLARRYPKRNSRRYAAWAWGFE